MRSTSQLFDSSQVTSWEDMAVEAINNSPSLFRTTNREEKHGMVETLASGLAATSRTNQLHAIRMLNQVTDLKREKDPFLMVLYVGYR
jgi:hypothetical protein